MKFQNKLIEELRAKDRKLYEYYLKVKALRRFPVVNIDGKEVFTKVTAEFDPNKGFDLRKIKDWTPAQKSKITKYFEEVKEATSRPFYPYKPRNKSNRKKALIFSGQKDLKGLNTVFIPVSDIEKPKIRFNDDNMIIVENNVIKQVILIDPELLAIDVEQAVLQATPHLNGNSNYTIMCGKYEIGARLGYRFELKEGIIKDIEYYQNRYSNPEDNHYWKSWLHGIVAYYSNNVRDLDRLLLDKNYQQQELKKRRKEMKKKYRTIFKKKK